MFVWVYIYVYACVFVQVSLSLSQGIILSGGQRQRISVARAFYQQTKVVFLVSAAHLQSTTILHLRSRCVVFDLILWSQTQMTH